MPEPFDTIIARSRAARARLQELRQKLNNAPAQDAQAMADETTRIMHEFVEEGRNLHNASKALHEQQASALKGARPALRSPGDDA